MNRSEEIAKAREVDTEIARLWSLYHEVNDKAIDKRKQADRLEKLLLQVSMRTRESYTRRINVLRFEADVLGEEAEPLREAAVEYDNAHYEGWSRFFLVQHIHSSQHCSSFRRNTRIGWLPDVSGLTEVEAVKEHGETLCTICFPSAPVELTTKPVDPNLCSGSGKFHSTEYLTGRENAYVSPSGYCPDCLRWNTLTKTGVMRKHKVDETRRHALTK